MHTVTLPEFREWLLKQEDGRRVAPMNGVINNHCGCMLVHYCREKEIPFTSCGFSCAMQGESVTLEVKGGQIGSGILNLFNDEICDKICSMRLEDTISYGELKENLI